MRDSSLILYELEQQLDRNLDHPVELGGLLKSFLHGPDVTDIVNELLASYLGAWDPRVIVERLDRESFLLLRNERFSMALKLFTTKSELLQTPGVDRFTVFKSTAPVTIDQYRIVGQFDPDVFDPNASLELVSSALSDGSCVCQGRLEPYVYDWHSPRPMIVAQLVRYPANSQLWFFSRETRRALFPVVGYIELSSLVLLSRMIAALGEKRAMPILEELSVHDSHAVRWAAIQAIGKLDRTAVVTYLKRSLMDKHPHIRRAAAKALAKLLE
jgi:hypothetical protein